MIRNQVIRDDGEVIKLMQTFERFVDVAQIKPMLQDALPGGKEGRWLITDCTILHAHYHTSTKHAHKARLNICYQLQGIDTLQQTPWTQLYYGRARADGESLADVTQAQTQPVVQPAIGPPLLHLPDQAITFWRFPNDPQLPHLPLVVDGELVKPYLPWPAMSAGWDGQPHAAQVKVALIHYYPEERCTLRYELRDGLAASPAVTTLIGKTYHNERGEQIYQRLQAAWQLACAVPEEFRTAQPLGYTAATKTLWMRYEAGVPLSAVINLDNAEPLLAAVARGLVALQGGHFPAVSPVTVDDLLHEMHNKVAKLTHALPTLATPLQSLAATLLHEAKRLPVAAAQVIHGDFHIRQLLVDQDEIIFLDFDELALGDPLQDVANFIVDLHFAGFPLPVVQALARCFLQAYGAYARWPVAPARLHWRLRYQFLNRAYRAYRQHRLTLHTDVAQILAWAETPAWYCPSP